MKKSRGQALRIGGQALISLLVFVVIATTVVAGAVMVSIANVRATGILAESEETLKMAESGVEKGILGLLRDPNYSGESLTFTYGTVTVSVTVGANYTILASAVTDVATRKVEVAGSFVNHQFAISSWKEVD